MGAAIASVSGEVDTIEILQGKSLPDTLERIKQQAIDAAIQTGADSGSARVVDITVLPIQVRMFLCCCLSKKLNRAFGQYVTNQATRFIVRAVGELTYDGILPQLLSDAWSSQDDQQDEAEEESIINEVTPEEKIDYTTYRPQIVGKEWVLTETDLCTSIRLAKGFCLNAHKHAVFIMEGCGILGTVRSFQYLPSVGPLIDDFITGRRRLALSCISHMPSNPARRRQDTYH